MIKFRAHPYYHGFEIEKVEVIRETAKSVYTVNSSGGKQRERREAKTSRYSTYFDTWGEARDYLLKAAKQNINHHHTKLKEGEMLLQEVTS